MIRIAIAVLALCCLTAPASAEPISTAIGLTALISTALGVGTGVAGLIGGAVVGVGISVAVSFASKLLQPNSAATDGVTPTTPSGAQTSLTAGAAVARNMIVGPQATAGQLTYWNLYGDDNRFLQLVFTLGVGPHDALTGVIVDGVRKTLGTPEALGTPITEYADGNGSHLWVRFFHGFYDQDADAQLVDNAMPAGRWSADNRGRGICYVSLTLEFVSEIFPSGVPSFLFELQGLRLYDPRKDSSNGGSGAHRWNDQHTWEYSDNVALGLYAFERGLYIGDGRIRQKSSTSGERVWNIGASHVAEVADDSPISWAECNGAQHRVDLASVAGDGYGMDQCRIVTIDSGNQ